MNKGLIIFIALYILAMFMACTSTEYDFGRDSKIVLNTFISTAEPPVVYLATSYTVGAEWQHDMHVPLLNAHVNMYEGDVKVADLIPDDLGRYSTKYLPKPNTAYTLIAKAPDLPQARGSVLLPDDVSLYDLTYSNQIVYIDSFRPNPYYPGSLVHVLDTINTVVVSFKYKDLSAKGNVYKVSLRKIKAIESGNNYYEFNSLIPMYGFSVNPKEAAHVLWNVYICEMYVFDSTYNDQEITVNYTIYDDFDEANLPITYYVYIENLAPDSYDYLSSLQAYAALKNSYNNAKDSAITVDFLKDEFVPNYVPYVIENPINGGYGFVGGASGVKDSIVIESF